MAKQKAQQQTPHVSNPRKSAYDLTTTSGWRGSAAVSSTKGSSLGDRSAYDLSAMTDRKRK